MQASLDNPESTSGSASCPSGWDSDTRDAKMSLEHQPHSLEVSITCIRLHQDQATTRLSRVSEVPELILCRVASSNLDATEAQLCLVLYGSSRTGLVAALALNSSKCLGQVIRQARGWRERMCRMRVLSNYADV